MDSQQRARYKQLANDAIIDLFGSESRETQLAEALEECVEWIEETSYKCATCSTCVHHGDHWDDDDWELGTEDEDE